MYSRESGRVISLSCLQFWNTTFSMRFRAIGNVTVTRLSQALKAPSLSTRTEAGMSTRLRRVHLRKALLTMASSESGSWTEVSAEQPSNA